MDALAAVVGQEVGVVAHALAGAETSIVAPAMTVAELAVRRIRWAFDAAIGAAVERKARASGGAAKVAARAVSGTTVEAVECRIANADGGIADFALGSRVTGSRAVTGAGAVTAAVADSSLATAEEGALFAEDASDA